MLRFLSSLAYLTVAYIALYLLVMLQNEKRASLIFFWVDSVYFRKGVPSRFVVSA